MLRKQPPAPAPVPLPVVTPPARSGYLGRQADDIDSMQAQLDGIRTQIRAAEQQFQQLSAPLDDAAAALRAQTDARGLADLLERLQARRTQLVAQIDVLRPYYDQALAERAQLLEARTEYQRAQQALDPTAQAVTAAIQKLAAVRDELSLVDRSAADAISGAINRMSLATRKHSDAAVALAEIEKRLAHLGNP